MSEQPGRYQRSASGMVAALGITVVAILGFVIFRSVFSQNLSVKPTEVDYRADVAYAQQSGLTIVYPASLPKGWIATDSDFAAGKRAAYGMSLLTADQQYVGFQQSPQTIPELLTKYVDPAPTSGDAVDVSGGVVTHWDTWSDSGGDTALVARWHGESLMVFGSADQAELEQVAAVLTSDHLSADTR